MQRVQRKVGERVRELRRATGYDQAAFATAAGLNRNWLGRVERGLQNLDMASLVRIAWLLRVNPVDLVSGIELTETDVLPDRKGRTPGAKVRRPPPINDITAEPAEKADE